MRVRLHPHAQQRLSERGASLEEVVAAVEKGEEFPAKLGRTGFRRNFLFESVWRGQFYQMKQLEAYAVKEGDDWLVITVITQFFSSGGAR